MHCKFCTCICYEITSEECVAFFCQSAESRTTQTFIAAFSNVFYESHSDILPRTAEILLEKTDVDRVTFWWASLNRQGTDNNSIQLLYLVKIDSVALCNCADIYTAAKMDLLRK